MLYAFLSLQDNLSKISAQINTPNNAKMKLAKKHTISMAVSMILKYAWRSQMLGVKRLGVRRELLDLGGECSNITLNQGDI